MQASPGPREPGPVPRVTFGRLAHSETSLVVLVLVLV